MSNCVRDVMTSHPVMLRQTASVLDAARAMAEANIGPCWSWTEMKRCEEW